MVNVRTFGSLLFALAGSATASAEQRPAQLSTAPSGVAVPATPTGELDPDIARAASEDQAARAEASAAEPSAVAASGRLASLNPKMSLILDTGLAWFGRADHLTQGGHAMDDNGLWLQGLEFAATASVDPFFRFDLAFQLTEAEIEEAYLTTLALPVGLQARAGMMSAAFGRQNPLHLHFWNFVNPPLSHTRFLSAEQLRGPGAELSMLMPLPWYLTLTGQAFGTTEELGFASASFGTSEMNASGRIGGPEDFLYVLRMENFFELSPDWSLLSGLSEALGQSPWVPDGRTYLHGGDLYLKWRPISSGQGEYALGLTLEYVLRDTRVPGGRLRDHGGYAELDALVTKRWMAGLRFDTTRRWEGIVPDPQVIPGKQTRGSASIAFLPTHFSKLRLQGDILRDRAHGGWGWASFVQAEVSAGEHGAHKF
ncbi:MAG: hypothetical protein JW940_07355 [Polyangiaceae bacterium]|nr:hypothetical protein [Polyangiaceae bacterium]